MTRVVAINILLILAPFLFYSAYVLLEKKPKDKQEFWKLIPAKTLFAVGLCFMAIFYISQITFQHPVKDGVYHPAEVRDGKVIPGYISPPEEKGASKDNPEKSQN
jgi:quinol-cytochrome oxidoreductase complex cytochrome b subunit